MAAKDMKIDPPTGIKVGIIGGGIGGLTAAIECHRKGHSVRVFERKGWFESFGMLWLVCIFFFNEHLLILFM